MQINLPLSKKNYSGTQKNNTIIKLENTCFLIEKLTLCTLVAKIFQLQRFEYLIAQSEYNHAQSGSSKQTKYMAGQAKRNDSRTPLAHYWLKYIDKGGENCEGNPMRITEESAREYNKKSGGVDVRVLTDGQTLLQKCDNSKLFNFVCLVLGPGKSEFGISGVGGGTWGGGLQIVTALVPLGEQLKRADLALPLENQIDIKVN